MKCADLSLIFPPVTSCSQSCLLCFPARGDVGGNLAMGGAGSEIRHRQSRDPSRLDLDPVDLTSSANRMGPFPVAGGGVGGSLVHHRRPGGRALAADGAKDQTMDMPRSSSESYNSRSGGRGYRPMDMRAAYSSMASASLSVLSPVYEAQPSNRTLPSSRSIGGRRVASYNLEASGGRHNTYFHGPADGEGGNNVVMHDGGEGAWEAGASPSVFERDPSAFSHRYHLGRGTLRR